MGNSPGQPQRVQRGQVLTGDLMNAIIAGLPGRILGDEIDAKAVGGGLVLSLREQARRRPAPELVFAKIATEVGAGEYTFTRDKGPGPTTGNCFALDSATGLAVNTRITLYWLEGAWWFAATSASAETTVDCCILSSSAQQACAAASNGDGTRTILSWDQENTDTNAMHAPGNPTRVTIQKDGFYLIHAAAWVNVNDDHQRAAALELLISGSEFVPAIVGFRGFSSLDSAMTNAVAATVFVAEGTWVRGLGPGAYLEIGLRNHVATQQRFRGSDFSVIRLGKR